jgi:hypothetical protein
MILTILVIEGRLEKHERSAKCMRALLAIFCQLVRWLEGTIYSWVIHRCQKFAINGNLKDNSKRVLSSTFYSLLF